MHEQELALLPYLRKHPRVDLGVVRTSIETLPRMSEQLGVDISVKRDDTLPLAMGGNKVRQLEYYLGPARNEGADTVLITGAVQSNFVRLCAAACRKLGWRPVIQLEDRVPRDDHAYNRSGNVLIERMLDAEVHYFHDGEDEVAADRSLDRIAGRLASEGSHPFTIHLGTDHPPLGGLGYVMCAAEVYLQCQTSGHMPDHVVIGSGSGLSHAGFLVGARACGWDVPVHGICVRREVIRQRPRVLQRARELNVMLGGGGRVRDGDILVDDDTFLPGYGKLNDDVVDAMRVAARMEGLLLDPVYTGRAMAGLISLVRRGIIEKGHSVLFVHTGGQPGIFAYQQQLDDIF